MNSRSHLEKTLSAKLSGMQITHESSGLSRAKATPPVLKTHSISPQKSFKFIPHPPQNHRPVGIQWSSRAEGKGVKPVPPGEPKAKKGAVRKFYDVRKQDSIVDEGRVSGDGESLENEEYYEKSRCPSWERMPGDGCISDIAEEDEDAEDENCDLEENDNDDDEEFVEGNVDDEYDDCDELDEGKGALTKTVLFRIFGRVCHLVLQVNWTLLFGAVIKGHSPQLLLWMSMLIRTVHPFVTAHKFCASWVWSKIFGFLKEFSY